MTRVLEIREIWKSFGDVKALRGVTLNVQKGELFVLLGPSGCGKTTLIRIVAGLEMADRGRVFIDGEAWDSRKPFQRNVAMVFQNFGLYPHRSVRGNIEYPLRVAGTARLERTNRCNEVARLLGIEALLDRRPRELSGGEAQRVALARALVREPACFLLDEPLGSLDAQLRFRTRGEIKRIQRELGVTTIYVTHDQSEALALGDRIALLDEGRVMQVGVGRDLLRKPANTFVAGFMGVPPAILLPGSYQGGKIELGTPNAVCGLACPSGVVLREGQEVVVGIQPDEIAISSDLLPSTGGDGQCLLQGRVELVEGVEPDLIVHCSTTLGAWSVRSARNPGSDSVLLSFGPNEITVFDAQTGMRIQDG